MSIAVLFCINVSQGTIRLFMWGKNESLPKKKHLTLYYIKTLQVFKKIFEYNSRAFFHLVVWGSHEMYI